MQILQLSKMMMRPSLLMIVVVIIVIASTMTVSVSATGNITIIPGQLSVEQQYDDDDEILYCGDDRITAVPTLNTLTEPEYVITEPLSELQLDTFQDLTYTTILGIPSVPTYKMIQPKRITVYNPLEFHLVLVRDFSPRSRTHIQIDDVEHIEAAQDSWFPGYYWQPLYIRCTRRRRRNSTETREERNQRKHIGWKFIKFSKQQKSDNNKNISASSTASLVLSSSSSSSDLPFFYALKIKVDVTITTKVVRVVVE